MKRPLRVKRCPHCGSADVTFDAGVVSGTYWCPRCHYRGPLVVEEDLDLDEAAPGDAAARDGA